nr:hypothetical protein [Rhodococcus sp. (in: high G+C Gram-positive bacteria)]
MDQHLVGIRSFLDLDPKERKPFYSLDEVLNLIAGSTLVGETRGHDRGYVAGLNEGYRDGFDDAAATFDKGSNA